MAAWNSRGWGAKVVPKAAENEGRPVSTQPPATALLRVSSAGPGMGACGVLKAAGLRSHLARRDYAMVKIDKPGLGGGQQ